MSEKLVDAIVNMKEDEALSITNELLEGGEDPMKILDLCREAGESWANDLRRAPIFSRKCSAPWMRITNASLLWSPG